MSDIKSWLKNTLKSFDIAITRHSTLERLKKASRNAGDLDFLRAMPKEALPELLRLIPESASQLRQDLFVAAETGFKQNGYFVEFGATDGVELSNTLLLEQKFGWQGILAEPGRRWQSALRKNRTCKVELDCVWSATGQRLTFFDATDPILSTISDLKDKDEHRVSRRSGDEYQVNTISLGDLLDKHAAPKAIDFLSIDTEGSELQILSAFDFTSRDIRIIACEHNYSPDREKIFSLLTSKGYRRKHEHISQFDDWYVRGE